MFPKESHANSMQFETALDMTLSVKLLAHRAGLPGKELFNYIVPLDPVCKTGFAGALPVKGQRTSCVLTGFTFRHDPSFLTAGTVAKKCGLL